MQNVEVAQLRSMVEAAPIERGFDEGDGGALMMRGQVGRATQGSQ